MQDNAVYAWRRFRRARSGTTHWSRSALEPIGLRTRSRLQRKKAVDIRCKIPQASEKRRSRSRGTGPAGNIYTILAHSCSTRPAAMRGLQRGSNRSRECRRSGAGRTSSIVSTEVRSGWRGQQQAARNGRSGGATWRAEEGVIRPDTKYRLQLNQGSRFPLWTTTSPNAMPAYPRKDHPVGRTCGLILDLRRAVLCGSSHPMVAAGSASVDRK
jgi:hypothetical protein